MAGFDVTMAANGEDAMRLLEGGFQPCLIILNLVMPKKTGYEFLKELNAREDVQTFPVIVVTNLSEPIVISKLMEIGASDYVIKSDTSLDEIISKINRL